MNDEKKYVETLNMCTFCTKNIPECGLPGVVFASEIENGNPKSPDADKVVGCKGFEMGW